MASTRLPAPMPGIDSGMTRSRILVGTCSWTDRTLTHDTDWYPKRSMSAAERLKFYASRFPIAEADSTYYFPPSAELTRGWAERTPASFTMNVKAYSLLTGHPTRPDSLWPDLRDAIKPEFAGKRNVYSSHLDPDSVEEAWRRFELALRPLRSAGKLGAVLLQYPEWFTARKSNRDELAAIRHHWPDMPACVEFRSPTWLTEPRDRDRTLQTLADLRLALVVVDAPRSAKLPVVPEATTPDLAVIRFSRPQRRRLEETWHHRRRTLRLPVHQAATAGLDTEDRSARRRGRHRPRPHEQLLPGQGCPQRRRPSRPARRLARLPDLRAESGKARPGHTSPNTPRSRRVGLVLARGPAPEVPVPRMWP